MKRFGLFFCAVFLLALSGCKTSEIKEIPEDLSAAQILQLGQDEESAYRYKNAETYFKTVIERFGANPAVYVEARYELGNCYMKEKAYEKAAVCFNEIIEIYNSAPYGSLPTAYQKLANLGLERIPD